MLKIIAHGRSAPRELRSLYESGQYLRVSSGVYLENPFESVRFNSRSEAEKVALINQALVYYAPLLINQLFGTAVISASSAHPSLAIDQTKISIFSTYSGTRVIGGDLQKALPQHAEYIKPLELVSSKAPIGESDLEPYPVQSDVIRRSAVMAGTEQFLRPMSLQRTKPIRTLVDCNRFDEADWRNLNDADYCELLGAAGFDMQDSNAVVGAIKAHCEGKPRFKHSFTKTAQRILRLAEQLKLDPHLRKHLAVGRMIHRARGKEASYDLYHYDERIGHIIEVAEDRWVLDTNGWLSPLYAEDLARHQLSPLMTNLFPEAYSIRPNQVRELFESAASYLSNLQVTRHGEPPAPATYLSASLGEQIQFDGVVSGFPELTELFDLSVARWMEQASFKLSGAQPKIAASLSEDALGLQSLRPAKGADRPFTHILKPSGRDENMVIGEWVGMTLSRAAGLEVPPFSLVEMSADEAPVPVDLSTRRAPEATNDIFANYYGETQQVQPASLANRVFRMSAPQGGDDPLAQRLAASMEELNRAFNAEEPRPEQCLAFVIERFDLGDKTDGKRWLSYDLCGLMGLEPREKYDSNFEMVAKVLKVYLEDWPGQSRVFFRQLVTAMVINNSDLHLKNINLIQDAAETRDLKFKLSPAYDMVVCSVVPGVTARFAMKLNGTDNPRVSDACRYAEVSLGIDGEEARAIVADVFARVESAVAEMTYSLPPLIEVDSDRSKRVRLAISQIRGRIDALTDLPLPRQEAQREAVHVDLGPQALF